ncbi:MAG: twin-arginine translocase subunit TatC [Gammaproteobacteria bacterium]|nr:twin-arginine translocase subunit TatC [Gammaproteobacteria bacterium]
MQPNTKSTSAVDLVSKNSSQNPHDRAVDNEEQPFLEHLIELRSRILRGVGVVGLLFIPLYFYANDIYTWISEPLTAQLPEGSSMIATQVASPFLTPLKVAFFAALFLGVPYLLHQIWAFISPGLYRHEKKFAMPLLFSSIALFYSGMAFVYFLVFPLVFAFFTQVAPEGVAIMTDINAYIDFVLKMFLAFGIAFEIPIATMLLAWSGLATAESMSNKRPYVIVGCFILGMLLTPPDVISQLLLALPTWLLFEVGVFLARFIEVREVREDSS